MSRRVIDVRGIGQNTLGIVKEAILHRNTAIDPKRPEDRYDQVWCVFDRDSFPATDFNAALALAQREGIRVAYSNEAFELWYLLHFFYRDTAMSRQDFGERLTELLGHPYQKNSLTMYAELDLRQHIAIRNARRLLSQYDPPRPAVDNPSTTVHLLVEELNRFPV